jgi:hypothetical protein
MKNFTYLFTKIILITLVFNYQNAIANEHCVFNTGLKSVMKYDAQNNVCCQLDRQGESYYELQRFNTLKRLIAESSQEIFQFVSSQIPNLGENDYSQLDAQLRQKIMDDTQEYIRQYNGQLSRDRTVGVIKGAAKDIAKSVFKNLKSLIAERLKSPAFYASLSQIARSAGVELLANFVTELFMGNHSYREIDLLSDEKDPAKKLKLLLNIYTMSDGHLCNFVGSTYGSMMTAGYRSRLPYTSYHDDTIRASDPIIDNLVVPFFKGQDELLANPPIVIRHNHSRCILRNTPEPQPVDILSSSSANQDPTRYDFPECRREQERERAFLADCIQSQSDSPKCIQYRLGYYPRFNADLFGINYTGHKHINAVAPIVLTNNDNFIPTFRSYIINTYKKLFKAMKMP